MATPNELQRTAWLFTRGDVSVTMRVRQDESGLTLDVNGPETASTSYQFTQMSALMAFAEAQQQRLLESGFQLHAVVDRRSGGDRRPDGGPERRRRSGD